MELQQPSCEGTGRDYIGCELHEDYGNLIQKRVQEYKPVQEVAQEPSINI